MQSLIPVECTSVRGFNNWWEASDYLYYIIDHGYGWVVNCDIDCFIYDWHKVEVIINEMKEGGFTHAGAHEGGDIPGRSRSWACMNPFFNIFNIEKIKELKGSLSWDQIKQTTFNPEWEKDKPGYLRDNINHVSDEPFHGLFYWLHGAGKSYFLQTTQHTDGISTDTGFGLHAWYSREFSTNHFHHSRILNLYEEAKTRNLERHTWV